MVRCMFFTMLRFGIFNIMLNSNVLITGQYNTLKNLQVHHVINLPLPDSQLYQPVSTDITSNLLIYKTLIQKNKYGENVLFKNDCSRISMCVRLYVIMN